MTKGKTFVSSEGADQVKLIQYLNLQYPKLLWMFDLAGTSEVIKGYASSYRPPYFKQPDFMLMKALTLRGNSLVEYYGGLFIELKKSDFKLYTKQGEYKKNEHIETQARSLLGLRKMGYWADFASGFDDAKQKIDAYIKGDVFLLEGKKILQ